MESGRRVEHHTLCSRLVARSMAQTPSPTNPDSMQVSRIFCYPRPRVTGRGVGLDMLDTDHSNPTCIGSRRSSVGR